jgi:anti-sigma regulatory factor (Ser/Thr protein kinase)
MAEALPELDGLVIAVAHLGAVTTGADGTWCDVAADDDGHVALTLVDARDASGPVAWELRRALQRVREADAAGQGVLDEDTVALGPRRSAAATVDGLDRAARAIPGATGARALCVVFDPAGVVRWSTAGCAPPSVAGPDGVRGLSGGSGTPLGCAEGATAQEQEALAAGTTIVLGVGPALADSGRWERPVLSEHHELAPAALAAALEESAPGDTEGGTLVLARLLPAPLEQRLPADPRRLSALRRAVAAWSAAAALGEDATADLQLLLSEAATNAVEHAYRGTDPGEFVYSVRRRRDGEVRVVVQDFGRWRPPPDDPGYRGRGLAVIHNLAHGITLDHTDHGTRIAFTMPGDAPTLGERPLTGVIQGWKPER